MNATLLSCVAAGPLFALLTAGMYRAALWMLGGIPTEGHVGWGIVLCVLACASAWTRAFSWADASAIETERDALREAADEALAALSDPDTAWTPAGTDARQALRGALGHPTVSVCERCGVDQGGHSSGCAEGRVLPASWKGGAA